MTIEVSTLVRAAGGRIVGKVRLQKMVYLIDQLGCPTGFPFEYHHYGPYSAELAEAVEDAEIFGEIASHPERRADGVPYVVYEAGETRERDVDSPLEAADIRSALQLMQSCSATVLELAATIHWLSFYEGIADWSRELIRRKGVKTEGGRTEQAIKLLRQLEIAPA